MVHEARLTGALRALLDSDRTGRFLRAPMIVPETRWFPDPWSPDAEGVRWLILRIMDHAGMGEVPCAIERFIVDGSADDGQGTAHGRHVVAFFEGVRDGACRFGVNCAQLGDPEYLIGVLAHEVAHAYRALHGLVVEDRDEEEELTDLTTVFLGFGVFTTNNAHRTSVYDGRQSTRNAGYLSPHAMALTLATWTRARACKGDADVAERWLEPMQRGMFLKALSRLDRRRVRASLGLSDARGEAAPRDDAPSQTLRDTPLVPVDAEPIDFAAARGDTFRVPVRHQWWAVPSGALFVPLFSCAFGATSAHWLAVAAVGALLGLRLGSALSYDKCARLTCGFRIPPRVARCPCCGAVVHGVIPPGTHYQDAAEALRRERVRARRDRSMRALPAP